MAKVTLRLFAGAREIAGNAAITYEANTVQELLTQAQDDLDGEFARILLNNIGNGLFYNLSFFFQVKRVLQQHCSR